MATFSGYRPCPPAESTDGPAYDDVDLGALYVLGTDHHMVPAPLERMVENVLDWEHLPFVHPENFCSSERLGSGRLWYRARVGSPPASRGVFNLVRVCVHPSLRRWFLTLEEGPNAGLVFGAEAVAVEPDKVEIELTFYLPEPPRNEAMARAMLSVYRNKLRLLYHQDIDMVVERQQGIERRAEGVTEVAPGGCLGSEAEVIARAPFLITTAGRRVWVQLRHDGLRTHTADCPHMGATLPCPDENATEHVCPWHAYRYDVATGYSTDGRNLRLRKPPGLSIRDGQVWLDG